MLTRTAPSVSALFLLFFLWAAPAHGALPAAGELDTGSLIRAALKADGARDPIDVTLDQRAIEQEVAEVIRKVGYGRPTYRRARRLHELLHKKYLTHYNVKADGLSDAVTRGTYNCVSGSLLYGLVARELGYEIRLIEFPGHVLLRMRIGDRLVDVETTSRHGFDTAQLGSPHGSDAGEVAGGREWTEGLLAAERREGRRYWSAPLEAVVGFTWLNRAWRTLEAGDPLHAAELAAEAARFLPGSETRADSVRPLLARAFRTEYERGAYEAAYRVAVIETRAFPELTTARDRLLASALKRIENACDDDDPELAETLLNDVRLLAGSSRDVERLARRAAPLIAAAAVRLGEWPLALRSAAAYAGVEPDPVEGARLRTWVESRMAGDGASAPRPR